ncbi:branched-chain amino acid ABC transporter permease [Thalassobaculum fulvum]|uniref:Branched-chain amino acid ABC transporter permease n=1 Tax=Thalassobaculum fulvum TaxID=1633335 RepID=A0A919CQ92_9PROT|nr:branched-chain amino acid ABC transporter permease [Thalassobaculum fulvum]GHD51346.1 branched-chain amino acid ABC transporter permease [Thalassobaculum fulvum]
MFHQTPLKTGAVLLLATAAVVYAFTTGFFGLELLTEVAILAIVAIALDLVAGYGGMVSLCHGALYGVGAYAFASATVLLGWGGGAGMAMAVAGGGAFAWLIGAVSARTHGIFFIMATLAFGQMAYAYFFDSPLFGGSDGMPGIARLDLSGAGLDLNDSRGYALFCTVLALLAYALAATLLRSGFGRTLVGIRANEPRMRALGLPVWRHKAAAFGTSGALAGLAGALAAQHTMYVSPGLLHWTVSGELLIMVILGGLGTLVGAVLGAGVLVFVKHEVARFTDHWHMVVGLVLIATVLSGGRGIFGQIEFLWGRRGARRPEPAATEGSPDHA